MKRIRGIVVALSLNDLSEKKKKLRMKKSINKDRRKISSSSLLRRSLGDCKFDEFLKWINFLPLALF